MGEAVGRLARAFPPVRQRVEGHHRERGAARRFRTDLGPRVRRRCRRCRDSAARSCRRSRVAWLLPRLTDRLKIESLGRIESGRGRQVSLAGVNATAAGEVAQKSDLRPVIERRDLDPFFERGEPPAGIRREALDEPLQKRGAKGGISTLLPGQPQVEFGAALDDKSFEQFAGVEVTERLQLLGAQRLDRALHGGGDLRGVHQPAVQPQRNGIAGRDHHISGDVFQHASQLAEAPPKLAPGVIGCLVPQQLAEPAAPRRALRQREIGEQPTRLA